MFNQTFQDKVKEWIESDGEVYIIIGFPRSGGAGRDLLVNSFDQFLQVLSVFQSRKGGVEVYRHPHILIRGIANEQLLQSALKTIPENTDWYLLCTDPNDWSNSLATGDRTHQQLEESIIRFYGREIALGLDVDFPPDNAVEGETVLKASNI